MFPKVKNIAILASVNLVSLAIILYGIEGYLRVTDPAGKLPYNGFQGETFYTWGNQVENNSLGFRERNVVTPKPNGIYRIMVLGDSLTWGAGLNSQQRYTNQLEKLLNERFQEKRVEVLNFGVSGGPTILERDILYKYKNQVEPDLIIVGFCLNDPQPRSEDYSMERAWFDKKYKGDIDPFIARLGSVGLKHVGDVFRRSIYKTAEIIGLIPPWEVGLGRVYEKNSNEWNAFLHALEDIKAMSDEMKLPPPIFITLNQGTRTDRPTDYNNPDERLQLYLKWYYQAEEAAANKGFRTSNVEKELAQEYTTKSIAVNILDGHPNADVNHLYARKLFEVISASLLIRH